MLPSSKIFQNRPKVGSRGRKLLKFCHIRWTHYCFLLQFSRPNTQVCQTYSERFHLRFVGTFLVHPVLRQVFANAVQPNCSPYLTCLRRCRFTISAWSSSLKQKVIFTNIQFINFSLTSIPKELSRQSAICFNRFQSG